MSFPRTKIVFFEFCGGATKFTSQTRAEEAAGIYSCERGYACEAFFCDKQHPDKHGDRADTGPCWHVRGKRPPERAEEKRWGIGLPPA
jgi:hypothetical protein